MKIHDETPQGKKLIGRQLDLHSGAGRAAGPSADLQQLEPVHGGRPDTVWLGLEYFCNQTDEIWNLPDERMGRLAKEELSKIGIIDTGEVLDCDRGARGKDISGLLRHL